MSSRPSFRPRPIDSSKPLPIVRTSKDLRHEDDVVVSRALPALGTGVEAAELEERHLQQALMASVFGEDASNKADIPVPVVLEVEPPALGQKEPFDRPKDHYILFDRSDADLEDSMVDYDADHEDEAFVTKYNATHKKSNTLTIDALERAIDLLEKLQGRFAANADGDCNMASSIKPSSKSCTKDGKRDRAPQETEDDLLSYGQARQDITSVLHTLSDAGRREVHAHWITRRLAHGGAIHRLYSKVPKVDDPNPAVAFRPRGREDIVGAGRRMNTYDNYKRAVLLRDEFRALGKVMKSVVSREESKAEHLALWALQMRVQCVMDAGSRMEVVSRSIAASEREGYSFENSDSRVVVSCRGLGVPLPENIERAMNRIPFGPDKSRPKKKKKGIPMSSSGSTAAPPTLAKFDTDGGEGLGADRLNDKNSDRQDLRPPLPHVSSHQPGVDSYGFDDHGNRFLKHMRYFAGGFMNYGVCPYDHRVFAAASERNTVKEQANEPRPFMFPNPALKFASNGGSKGAKLRPRDVPLLGLQGSSGESARPYGPPGGEGFSNEISVSRGIAKRTRPPVKVRARVGRGGRIIFDRVIFEPERGVKAASYPASVEMGGVYSAGLPLETAPKVVAQGYRSGAYGSIGLLGRQAPAGDPANNLVTELRPMLTLAEARLESDGRTTYWPLRQHARWRGTHFDSDSSNATMVRVGEGVRTRSGLNIASNIRLGQARHATVSSENGDPVYRVPCTEDNLRALPAYATRSAPLVTVVNNT